MLEAVRRSVVAASECAEASVWAQSSGTVLQCLDGVEQAERLLAAAKLRLIRQVDVQGIAAAEGTPRVAMWLWGRYRITPAAARRLVRLAAALEDSPALDQALGNAMVSVEQAAAIVKAVDAVPAGLGAAVRAKAEAEMLGWAGQLDAQQLAHIGTRVLHYVAPEVAEAVDAKRIDRDNAAAYAARTLSVRDQGDGRVRLTGWLDTEMAAVVSAALDPLCSPRHRRAAGPGAGADADGDGGPGGDGRLGGVEGSGGVEGLGGGLRPGGGAGDRPAVADPVVADERSYGQRRADALVEVCRLALNTGQLPENGGDRPQLTITMSFTDLRDQVGAATLDNGHRLTPAQARRLACDAHLLPAVLGSQSQVIDVGRSRRLITGALRRALVVRDGGCAFPGCDRPPRWAEGHHIRSWVDGGPTSLDNSVLLCGQHHRLVHHSDWRVRLATDGRPEFLPPAYVDLEQRPRRNIYHHRT